MAETKKFILLAAVDNRPTLLDACLSSLQMFPDWILVFVGQEFDEERKEHVRQAVRVPALYKWCDEKVGMHNAKLYGLQLIQSQSAKHVVISIDDDMEFIDQTDFNSMGEICQNKDIGLVSGNWVRSEKMLKNKRLRNEIKKQAIVYTAGGMAFSNKITRLIVNAGENDFWCDNTEWSLISYTNGYTNLRYLGSLAIHRILSAGGRKSYVDAERKLPSAELVTLRPDKTGGHIIPAQRDLTAFAKFRHKLNKK